MLVAYTCVCGWEGERERERERERETRKKVMVSHSNLEVLDKICFALLGSNDNGLIGDVGKRDQVLTMTVLGGRLTNHQDKYLYRVGERGKR